MALGLNPRSTTRGSLLIVDAANPASLATNISRNLLTNTEDFSSAAWNTRWGGAGTLSLNMDTAPDGTITADNFIATVGGSGVGQAVSVIAGTTYTFSIYVKSLTNVNLTARMDNTGGAFGLTDNLTVSTNLRTWTRATLTWTETLTTTRYVGITVSNGVSFTAWGAQLEVGSSATDYYSVNTPASALNTLWKDLTYTNRNYSSDLTTVEVLVVGGGGAGGSGNNNGYEAGGGGGGGVVYNAAFPVSANTSYPVVVGLGGQSIPSGGTPTDNLNNNGENSSFSTLTALGGGAGGVGGFSGKNGGSGGGGAFANGTPRSRGGVSLQSQGSAGGIAAQSQLGDSGNRGGGGGGSNPTLGNGGSGQLFGNGGAGAIYSITGTAVMYAAGGGGNQGVGGITGAGNGGQTGTSGVDGFGHGGGAGSWDGASANPIGRGGNGGAGTVIVRYPAPQRATGGTITTVGGNIIHRFPIGSSTFTVVPSNEDPRSWGILTNGVTYDSRNGGSLNFDNVDDYVDFPSLTPITDSELSVFAWVYLNATPAGTNGIWGHFGSSYNGAANNCHFEIQSSGLTRIRLGQVNNAALPALAVRQWKYVGFTTNGFTHNYYVDGVLSTTWTGTVATTSIQASSANSFTVTHATSPVNRFQEGCYVTISGATPSQFNGTWLISSSSSGSFTVFAPVSPAIATVQGTVLYGTGTLLGSTPGSHFIGRSDATRTWNGRIAHVVVSGVALTATEIANNFNALRGRYGV